MVQAAGISGSVSVNYDGSRTSQMLAEFVPQFSALHCKSREKKLKKKKRR
jgi:hypothetical protein